LNKPNETFFLVRFSYCVTSFRLFCWRLFAGYKNKMIYGSTFRGYASQDKLFIQGRISRYRHIKNNPEASPLEHLLDTIKRIFNTRIPDIPCEISVLNHIFLTTTNSAGYFTLEINWPSPFYPSCSCWLNVAIEVKPILDFYIEKSTLTGEILFISNKQKFIVISDIDDTLLLTGVKSMFYWKVLYNTFLKNMEQRRGIPGAPAFFQRLTQLKNQADWQTFVFYVSSTPRTLYDFVLTWLDRCHFPKGPILLKDFGLSTLDKGASQRFKSKLAWIKHVMSFFPTIPFVLVGDSGEKDFFLYQKLAEEYPTMVKAILIRDIPFLRSKNKLVQAMDDFKNDVPLCLFKDYKEARIWVQNYLPELMDINELR
jgi:phosphatidate phosphatase APP1